MNPRFQPIVEWGLEQSLADLVAGRARAGARRVWVRLVWKGSRSYLTTCDDGPAPGCGEPLASLGDPAWCARVVAQVRGPERRSWAWQADPVGGEWFRLSTLSADSHKRLDDRWSEVSRGNLLLFEDLRGLREVRDRDAHRFSERVKNLVRFLSAALHRRLEEGLSVFVGGSRLVPEDPFRFRQVTRLGRKVVSAHGHEFGLQLLRVRQRQGVPPQGLFLYHQQRLILAGEWAGLSPAEWPGACLSLEVPESWPLVERLRNSSLEGALPAEVSSALKRMIRFLRDRTPRTEASEAPDDGRGARLWRVLAERVPGHYAPFRGSLEALVCELFRRGGQASMEVLSRRLAQPERFVRQQLERLALLLGQPEPRGAQAAPLARVALTVSLDGRQVVLLLEEAERLVGVEQATERPGRPVPRTLAPERAGWRPLPRAERGPDTRVSATVPRTS
ncbi:MAG: hypothetical protein AB1758_01910 [Candidatus Eremiobacterota bacterium]